PPGCSQAPDPRRCSREPGTSAVRPPRPDILLACLLDPVSTPAREASATASASIVGTAAAAVGGGGGVPPSRKKSGIGLSSRPAVLLLLLLLCCWNACGGGGALAEDTTSHVLSRSRRVQGRPACASATSARSTN
ncbi:unnamed protein product, partial [Ectocarpus fasciculatus]